MSPSDEGLFARAVAALGPPDQATAAAASAHHLRLTKPPGSLGRLEGAGVQLAAIAGVVPPPIPEPATVAVFAGDHGVAADGVTSWPQEVTAQMVANFCAGGAAVNVLARHVGATVVVVDVGVASYLEPSPGLVDRKVRRGTDSLVVGPAMSVDDARQALDVGAGVAAEAVAAGARCLVTGDMGIGNTTPAAALIAAFTGRRASHVTGRGTGIDDVMLMRKTLIVEAAVSRAVGEGRPHSPDDALDALAALGGLELAALAGFAVGGAAARVPVIVDGVIALAALLVAERLAPGVTGYCIAGHRSTEPGASAALEHLGMEPLLDLEMRLGEGSGACLALPILQAAAKVLGEMATFDSAGVTQKE